MRSARLVLATIGNGPSGARSGSQTYSRASALQFGRDLNTFSKAFRRDEGSLENEPVTMATNEENKDLIAVNVKLTSPRDASDRSRLSIVFNATQAALPVLGS